MKPRPPNACRWRCRRALLRRDAGESKGEREPQEFKEPQESITKYTKPAAGLVSDWVESSYSICHRGSPAQKPRPGGSSSQTPIKSPYHKKTKLGSPPRNRVSFTSPVKDSEVEFICR